MMRPLLKLAVTHSSVGTICFGSYERVRPYLWTPASPVILTSGSLLMAPLLGILPSFLALDQPCSEAKGIRKANDVLELTEAGLPTRSLAPHTSGAHTVLRTAVASTCSYSPVKSSYGQLQPVS